MWSQSPSFPWEQSTRHTLFNKICHRIVQLITWPLITNIVTHCAKLRISNLTTHVCLSVKSKWDRTNRWTRLQGEIEIPHWSKRRIWRIILTIWLVHTVPGRKSFVLGEVGGSAPCDIYHCKRAGLCIGVKKTHFLLLWVKLLILRFAQLRPYMSHKRLQNNRPMVIWSKYIAKYRVSYRILIIFDDIP